MKIIHGSARWQHNVFSKNDQTWLVNTPTCRCLYTKYMVERRFRCVLIVTKHWGATERWKAMNLIFGRGGFLIDSLCTSIIIYHQLLLTFCYPLFGFHLGKNRAPCCDTLDLRMLRTNPSGWMRKGATFESLISCTIKHGSWNNMEPLLESTTLCIAIENLQTPLFENQP